MADINPSHETNIASVFQEITANSDEVTGKILKKIDKLSKKGEYELVVKTDERTYDHFNYKGHPCPPLVEKLKSMGFKLSCDRGDGFWGGWKYLLKITW